MRKEINDQTMRMHMRTTINFKDIGLFKQNKGGNPYGESYSGNHIAIFECNMKAPPQMSFIDHTYKEIMDNYRININKNKWKIVDIDNYMKGNSYFEKIEEEAVWKKNIHEKMDH